ncbi:hypothetical protein PVAP13_3KG189327 [Panicum virgatum]|uniref:Uncharacterized protein n=1 Tax=Panicum virgatum TaxID=38727 RepID=A0A8T0UST3_PANVG|nr:hypothetical protein PVAP13_3KG189327 [Panicum virgatum]
MCLIALLEFDASDGFRIKVTFVHKQLHALHSYRNAINAENRPPVQQQLQIRSPMWHHFTSHRVTGEHAAL